MFKKFIALLLVQIYMVAAFGMTVNIQVCCEEPEMEVTCHGEEMLVLPQIDLTDPESTLKTIDCDLCLEHDNQHSENCCPDCEVFVAEVSKDSQLTEQTYTNTASKISLQNLQAAIILLPWVASSLSIQDLTETGPVRITRSADSSGEIPIFIRNCNYRI